MRNTKTRNKNKKRKIEVSSRNCTILNGGTQVSIYGTGMLYDREDVKILPDYYLDKFDKARLEAVKKIAP